MELAVKFGAATQESANSAQASSSEEDGAMDIPEPPIPECEPWASMDLLNKEREIVGSTFLATPWTSSGLRWTTSAPRTAWPGWNMEREKGKMLTFGGLITAAEHRISKSGRPWGFFALEDYHGAHEFRCFGEDYVRFKEFMVEGWMVMVTTHDKARVWP